MSTRIVAERNHRTLLELVLKPGNDICADCKARAPRWASYNLGIFICMNCASIHRKIGTHVTKVKSITLDEWSKEQVEVMKDKGNIKSNALYNPNEARHPPPTNMVDSERDSDLEKFIRSKYELKRFMDRRTSAAFLGDSRTSFIALRSQSTPLVSAAQIGRKPSPGPPPPPKTPENLPPGFKSPTLHPPRSVSHPLPPPSSSDKLSAALPLRSPAGMQSSVEKPAGQVWEDLISFQGPSQSSSLPLQFSPVAPVQHQPTTPSHATMTLATSPISVSTRDLQFPFGPSAPLSSPALHAGTTNPFNHTPLLPSSTASMNGTSFSTNSNPFSSLPVPLSMTMSTPSTPSLQPVMALPTGSLPHTPTLPYTQSQMAVPSFLPAQFNSAPTATAAGVGQTLFVPVSAPGQIPLVVTGSTNPFSAMQMGHARFPDASQAPFLNQQQQPGAMNAYAGWAGHGRQGAL